MATESSVHDPVKVTEEAFVSGGRIDLRLDVGTYEIRAGDANDLRVEMSGRTDGATCAIAANGTQATITVSRTPRQGFRATISVPARTDVTVELSAGNLTMAPIAGNKDIVSHAGNVTIAVGRTDDYARVDASLMAGTIAAEIFGRTSSGLLPRLHWTGPGSYTLRAKLTAGDLVLHA